MAGKGIGIPLKLLHEAEGFVVTVGIAVQSAAARCALSAAVPEQDCSPASQLHRRHARMPRA